MDANDLIARLLRQRESPLEVAPGKVLRVRRPDAVDMAALARMRNDDQAAEWFAARVVGWDGITEADLLGEAIGSDTPAPWSPALALTVLRDRPGWAGKVSAHVLEQVQAHRQQQGDVEKN